MTTSPPWHSADGLIQAFGDEAYNSAVGLMTMMILETPDDAQSIEQIRLGIIDLMQRGYHKKGKSTQQ